AIAHLLVVETAVIMALRELYGVVVRIISLQDDFARGLAAACASGDLGKQLEGALGSAKVRKAQGEIRANNPNKCYAVNVVPFGDHLRAHKQIDLSGVKLVEHAFKIVAGAHGIAVQAANARLRKSSMQSLFNFFRARAQKINV